METATVFRFLACFGAIAMGIVTAKVVGEVMPDNGWLALLAAFGSVFLGLRQLDKK